MNKKIAILSIITSIFLTACSGDVPKQDDPAITQKIGDTAAAIARTDTADKEALADATVVSPSITNVDPKLSAQVQSIYNIYLLIKTALVAGKSKEAASGATDISKLTTGFDVTGMPVDQIKEYKMHTAAIQQQATNIASTQDIKVQRKVFSPLSEQVYELIRSFGTDKTIYQEHCPMAFDGKGASWLSNEVAIRNPYFGDEMLECGEVTHVIKK